MLAVAYDNGGSLLKFGGDALLLWFDGDGHAARAARATVLMRSVSAARSGGSSCPTRRSRCGWRRACIRDASISSRSATRISSCWRRDPRGAGWSRCSTRRSAGRDCRQRRDGGRARSGRVPRRAEGSGVCCSREPPGNVREDAAASRGRRWRRRRWRAACRKPCASTCVWRARLPEHRPVTVAFIRYGGTDALIEHQGQGGRGQRAPAAADDRRASRRGAGRLVPRLRRRHRRRKADPHGRRAEGHRRRRGAHAARAARDRGERACHSLSTSARTVAPCSPATSVLLTDARTRSWATR